MSEFPTPGTFPRTSEVSSLYIELLFQESWEKNEENYRRRIEELMTLRSLLADYEVKGFTPFDGITTNRISDIIPYDERNSTTKGYTLYPGSNDVVFFKVNDACYSLRGDSVSYSPHSQELVKGDSVYDGVPVYFSERYTELKTNDDVCGYIRLSSVRVRNVLFHRHVDGIVRSYSSNSYFRYNGLLFEKTKKGKLESRTVVVVRPFPDHSVDTVVKVNEEVLLLEKYCNYIFRHKGEWYECCAKGVRHVKSDTMTGVRFSDTPCNAYYYEGNLYVITYRNCFTVYTFPE